VQARRWLQGDAIASLTMPEKKLARSGHGSVIHVTETQFGGIRRTFTPHPGVRDRSRRRRSSEMLLADVFRVVVIDELGSGLPGCKRLAVAASSSRQIQRSGPTGPPAWDEPWSLPHFTEPFMASLANWPEGDRV